MYLYAGVIRPGAESRSRRDEHSTAFLSFSCCNWAQYPTDRERGGGVGGTPVCVTLPLPLRVQVSGRSVLASIRNTLLRKYLRAEHDYVRAWQLASTSLRHVLTP